MYYKEIMPYDVTGRSFVGNIHEHTEVTLDGTRPAAWQIDAWHREWMSSLKSISDLLSYTKRLIWQRHLRVKS